MQIIFRAIRIKSSYYFRHLSKYIVKIMILAFSLIKVRKTRHDKIKELLKVKILEIAKIINLLSFHCLKKRWSTLIVTMRSMIYEMSLEIKAIVFIFRENLSKIQNLMCLQTLLVNWQNPLVMIILFLKRMSLKNWKKMRLKSWKTIMLVSQNLRDRWTLDRKSKISLEELLRGFIVEIHIMTKLILRFKNPIRASLNNNFKKAIKRESKTFKFDDLFVKQNISKP